MKVVKEVIIHTESLHTVSTMADVDQYIKIAITDLDSKDKKSITVSLTKDEAMTLAEEINNFIKNM